MTDRIIPDWEPAPLPTGAPPTPGGSSSIAGGHVGLTGRALVGPSHRIPILYGRCLISPDLAMAAQASRSGMRYGKFLAVISEGPIDAIESWTGATTNDFEVYESTLGVLTTPSSNLFGMIGLAGAYFEMRNSRPWSPACIARGRKLFDPRLGAWGAGEYPDPTKCAYGTNLALAFADLRTFPQYGDLLPSQVDWQSVEDAADWCDEIVDGAKRYELNLWLTHGDSAESWLETLGLHGGLRWREEGGLWKLDFSQPVTTVSATITDDHVFADSTPAASFGGGAGLADRPNRFRAEWIDPASGWTVRTVELRHPEVEAGAPIRDAAVYKLHGFHSEAMALRALWRIAHEIWSEQTLELELSTEMLHLQEGSRVTIDLPCLGISGDDYLVTKLTYDGDRINAAFQRYDTTTWTSPSAAGDPLPDDGFFDTPADPTGVEWLPRTVQRQIPLDDGTIAEQSATGLEIRFDPISNPFASRVLVRYRQAHETGAEGITSVLVVDGGLGYTHGSAVTVTGAAGGSGFAGTITTDGSGTITGVTISDPGSGYDPADSGLALSVAGGSTQAATLRPVFDAVVADIWDDPAAIEIPFPPTGNAPSVGGKNVIQLPLSVGPWPEPLYAASDLLLDFDERTIGGPTTWSVALRVQSVPALLSSGLAVQGGPAYPWSTTVIDYPVVRRELAGLTANRLPKWNGNRLADSKLSDDGTTPRYDGSAIYHEGNPPPAGDTFPAGAIVAYGGSAAPDGWLLCDGSAVSRTTHADLFAVLGTTHGVGDGSTTFNLPDLRDRFVRGKGAASAIGDTGGAATHDHAVGLAVGTSGTNARASGDTLAQDASPVSGHLTVDHYHSSTVAGDTATESSLPPYLVEVWIIKTSGTPSAATAHNTLASRDAAGAHPASSISFTPAGTISATTVQAAIEEVAAEAAGGGAALTVKEDDGSPSVSDVTEIRFSGATVESVSAGVVRVTVAGGGGTPLGTLPIIADPLASAPSGWERTPTGLLVSAGDRVFSSAAIGAHWTQRNPSLIATLDADTTVPDGLYLRGVDNNTGSFTPTSVGSGFVGVDCAGDFELTARVGTTECPDSYRYFVIGFTGSGAGAGTAYGYFHLRTTIFGTSGSSDLSCTAAEAENGIWVLVRRSGATLSIWYSKDNVSVPPSSWTFINTQTATAAPLRVGVAASRWGGANAFPGGYLRYWQLISTDQAGYLPSSAADARRLHATGIVSASPIPLIAALDLGDATATVDEAALRVAAAAAINVRSVDDSTWEFSAVRSSGTPAAGTYQAASLLTVAGSGRYLGLWARLASPASDAAGSLDPREIRFRYTPA